MAISHMLGFDGDSPEFSESISLSILDDEQAPNAPKSADAVPPSEEISTVQSKRLENAEISNLISSLKKSSTSDAPADDDLLALMDSAS